MGAVCCEDRPENQSNVSTDFKNAHETLYSDVEEDQKAIDELRAKLSGKFLNHFRDIKE